MEVEKESHLSSIFWRCNLHVSVREVVEGDGHILLEVEAPDVDDLLCK